MTVVPFTEQLAAAVTEHELFVYEPESEPLEQERACETQLCPYATVLFWYAVVD